MMFSLLLLLLLPSFASAASSGGLAAHFHSRLTDTASGEIRTVPLIDLPGPTSTSPAPLSGFSFTLDLELPQTWSTFSSPGDVYPSGALLTFEFGTSEETTQQLAALSMFNFPTFEFLGVPMNGPNLQHFVRETSGWHSLGFSVDLSAGIATWSFDNSTKTSTDLEAFSNLSLESFLNPSNSLSPTLPVYLKIGKDTASDPGFQGKIDNICVYTTALTSNELKAASLSGACSPIPDTIDASVPSLAASLLFDSDRLIEPSVFDDVTGGFVGYKSSLGSDGLLFGFGSTNVVGLTLARGSAENAIAAGESGFVCTTAAEACELAAFIFADGRGVAAATLVASPSTGTLSLNGAPWTVGTPASVDDAIAYAGFTGDTDSDYLLSFSLSLTFSDASLSPSSSVAHHLRFNTPPVALGNTRPYTMDAGGATVVAAFAVGDHDREGGRYVTKVRVKGGCEGIEFYNFSPDWRHDAVEGYVEEYGETVYYFSDDYSGGDDDSGDDYNAYDDYYSVLPFYSDTFDQMIWSIGQEADAGLAPDPFPDLTTPTFVPIDDFYGRIFLFSTHTTHDSEFECTLEYVHDDGELVSSVSEVSVTFNDPPYTPTIDAISLNIDEDTNSPVTVSSLVHSEDASTALLILHVDETTHGTYYQADGVTPILTNSASATISQYPVSATASTEWPEEGVNAAALVGPPDLWPESADAAGSWQPYYGKHGEFLEETGELPFTSQTITVEVETPVYLSQVTVYETWSPNRVMEVHAKDHDGGAGAPWIRVWARSGPPLGSDASTLLASVEDFLVCSVSFRSKFVKLIIKIESEDHWYAIDSVSVVGVEQLASNVVVGGLSGGGDLLFFPDEHFHGTSSTRVEISDCRYFLRNRQIGAEARSALISVTVEPVNDVPVIDKSKLEIAASLSVPTVSDLSALVFDIEDDTHLLTFDLRHVDGDSPYGSVENLTYAFSDLAISSHGTAQINGSEVTFTPNAKVIANSLDEVELNKVLLMEATATLTVIDKDGGAASAVITWWLEGLGRAAGLGNSEIAAAGKFRGCMSAFWRILL